MTTIHNLLIGKMYIEWKGTTQITNHNTGEKCDIEWKERGWSGKNAFMVDGICKNEYGLPKLRVHGRLTESLSV